MAVPLIGTLNALLGSLPTILQIIQYIVYIFLVFFLGGIAMHGFRKKIHLGVKILGIVALGLVCLIAGVAISGFLPMFSTGIFKVFQLGLYIGGIIAAIIIAIALYMISRKSAEKGKLDQLEDEIEKIKSILLKQQIIRGLTEDGAKKEAEKVVKGFKAQKVLEKGEEFIVTLQKGKKEVQCIVDAFTGKVKEVTYHKSKIANFFIDPFKAIGIVIIAMLLLFTAMNFGGFPSMAQELENVLGFPLGELGMGTENQTELPEGCVDLYTLYGAFGNNLLNNSVTNEQVRQMAEAEGKSVTEIFMVTYEGNDIYLIVTQENEICSATENQICECFTLPGL